MASSETGEIQGKTRFIGALRMQLGTDRDRGLVPPGSSRASTLPTVVIPMADSPGTSRQSGMDLGTLGGFITLIWLGLITPNLFPSDVVGQKPRLTEMDSTSSSRRGSLDGSTVLKKTRPRKGAAHCVVTHVLPRLTDPSALTPEPIMERTGTPDHTSNTQESRTTSLSQIIRAPSQALRDVFQGVFGSQPSNDNLEKEVKYPTLPALNLRAGSMPGAFPESPQKGVTAIELPQATGIGSEISTTRPGTLVFESRGIYPYHPLAFGSDWCPYD